MRQRCLLVVDDDVAVREALTGVLQAEDYRVSSAACAEEAVIRFNEAPIDLVLLDINLGPEDGWKVFSALKSRQPDLPIIVASAHRDSLQAPCSCSTSPVTAALEKPFDIPTLLELLRISFNENVEIQVQPRRPTALDRGQKSWLKKTAAFALAAGLSFFCRAQTPAVATSFNIDLRIQGGNAIVSWPAGSTTNKVQLQQANNPSGPWQNIGSPTSASSITNPLNGPVGFYRLLIATNAGVSSTTNITNPGSGQFQWAKAGVVPLYATPVSVAADKSGNSVAVGFFENTVDFGGGPLVSAGGYDGFIVKYNSQGTFLWAKRFGSLASHEAAKAVAIDPSGNIIVAGYFGGTVDFGGQVLTAVGNTSDPYAPDIFVAKYDTSTPARLLWVKQFGGTYGDYGQTVSVDSGGNIFLGAQISSPTVTFGNTTLNNMGGMALVKLSPAGSVLWAKGVGGSELSLASGAVDSAGDLLVAGGFYGSTDLGGGIRTSPGGNGAFLAKYSGLDGHYLWDKGIGTTSAVAQSAYGVSTDPVTRNVLITGQFGSGANFGGPMTDFYGNPNGVGGVFLAAYDSSGNFLWARTPNLASYGAADEVGCGVTIDTQSNVYFTGKVNSAVYFGTGQILLGGHDNFVASVTASGAPRWAKRSSGASGMGLGITVDSGGHVLTAGQVSNATLYFDDTLGAAGGSVSTTSGLTAPFLAQFSE